MIRRENRSRKRFRFSQASIFLVLLFSGFLGSGEAAEGYADRIPVEKVVGLFPKSWASNVISNWPKVRAALRRQHLDDDREITLYALATIRVETVSFSPVAEKPSQYSRHNDEVGYAGITGIIVERDFGSYDSTLRFTKSGRVIVNKGLGNCYYRGKDEELMRSRNGDPPLSPCDDGARYRGRGFVQITGKSNYLRMQNYLVKYYAIDLVNNPELAADADHAADILAAYLAALRPEISSALARNDFLAARKLVNSAGLGLSDFQGVFVKADEEGL